MTAFRMFRLSDSDSRISEVVGAMERFELQPSYQRQSEVWSKDKRALFIDSLINGYDVPKLYFHRLPSGASGGYMYAIVDGKQRLESIRGFLADVFPLSPDFVDTKTGDGAAAGLKYSALTRKHPRIAGRLVERTLDVVVIETDDLEVIEELFSRLNEAVPLNAPEKRNAFGGPMPKVIRSLVRDHVFFVDRLPIENTRYRQYDLATKFLFLADAGKGAAVKKRDLDDFVDAFTGPSPRRSAAESAAIEARVAGILDGMSAVFESQDSLLSSVGLVTVYFIAFMYATERPALQGQLVRENLVNFDKLRRHNRLVLRQQQVAITTGKTAVENLQVDTMLAIFDRLMQSPNDGQALEYRFRILEAFLTGKKFGGLPEAVQNRFELSDVTSR